MASPGAQKTASSATKELDEDDDYMTMAFNEPPSSFRVETPLQRRQRKIREAEARARPKSKAEIAAEAERARESALGTTISETSKGAKMMAKLGYKAGSVLGAPGNVHARSEPISIDVKEGKEGIGALNEKKRKFREEIERAGESAKKLKEDQDDFRERTVREREEKRAEGQWWGAMKVLEGLIDEHSDANTGATKVKQKTEPMDVPVLYRPLVVERWEKDKASRQRHDLLQSLSRLPTYDDPEEDTYDRQAFGKEIEGDYEAEDDEELQEYLALSPVERLAKMMTELREEWLYCFWCKYRYASKDALSAECPGEGEDEHG